MGEKVKVLELPKATVYRSSMFGWNVMEVHDLLVEEGPYAQHASALHVSFRRPRKRSREGFVDYHKGDDRCVVVGGWGLPAIIRDPLQKTEGGSMTRYSSFDPAYTVEFREDLAKFLSENPNVVVHDFSKVV